MNRPLRLAAALILASALHYNGTAQNLAVNNDGSAAHSSAIIDAKSTSKGVLVPRMSKAQKIAIPAPATGLLVFQETPDSVGFHYYNGTEWVWLANASSSVGWLTTGNSGTDSAVNFLGTLDDKPLMLRQNNLWMGQLNTKMDNYFIGGGSGFNNTTGKQNTAMGDSALFNSTTGTGNTAIGFRSMKGSGPITGGINVAVGNNTLSNLTSGAQNVAIGDNALTSMKTGGINVIIGAGAMEQATAGSGNIGLGLWALRASDSGYNNIAIGTESLYFNDSARSIGIGVDALAYSNRNNLVGIGHEAGFLNNYLQTDPQLGIENTYVGYQSGYYANTGSYNVAVGNGALVGAGFFNSNSPGNAFYKRNVVVGDSAMAYSYGSDNVALGYKALSKSYNSSRHVAVGSRALLNTSATYPNTAVGYSSQDSCTTSGANTSMGSFSLMSNKQGYNNTAVGNAAMMEAVNLANGPSMFDNTAIGNDALRLTRYYGQTAVGAGALRNDTSGVYNTAVGYLSMYENKRGISNTAVGTSALRFDTTGSLNTAVGVNALIYHRNGDNNVAIGGEALFNDIDGGANTAVGTAALRSHKTNGVNTAIGYESMYYDSSGSYNAAMGYRSLRYTKSGFENTALGVGAIEFSDSSYYNTAVGRGAMIALGGTFNTAIGYVAQGFGVHAPTTNHYVHKATAVGAYAGWKNIGDENTFVGYVSGQGAGADSIRGIENTGMGSYTLSYLTTGKSNTAVGIGALFNTSTGKGNVAVGTRAALYGIAGNYNVAIGDSALFSNANGSRNIAIGNQALANNTSSLNNIAIGDSAMALNTSSGSNIAIGQNALKKGSGYNLSIAIGTESLTNNVDGYENVATGYYAMRANTSGFQNSAYGIGAMEKNTTGYNNVAFGRSALFTNLTGRYNTAIGMEAMQAQDSGFYNTGIGFRSLYGNKPTNASQGNLNTATGGFSLSNNTTGVGNTGIGYNANVASGGLSNATAIGLSAYVAQSNSLVLGSIAGVNGGAATVTVGIGTTTPDARLHVIRNGASGGTYLSNSSVIVEDNAASFVQLSNPSATEGGILSGSELTTIRSGMVFGTDSSVMLRAGGNATRVYVGNSGFTGFNRTPVVGTTTGTVQLSNVGSSNDILGLYQSSSGNHWTYWVSSSATPDLFMYFNGTLRGSWNNTNGVYSSFSDRRLKKDITELPVGTLEKIKNLKSYSFHYNDNTAGDPLTVGFMAQDVQPLFPEAVTELTNKDGSTSLGLKYQYFGVYAIRAIQEQQALIDQQAKENTELKKKNEELEKDIRLIKAKLGL